MLKVNKKEYATTSAILVYPGDLSDGCHTEMLTWDEAGRTEDHQWTCPGSRSSLRSCLQSCLRRQLLGNGACVGALPGVHRQWRSVGLGRWVPVREAGKKSPGHEFFGVPILLYFFQAERHFLRTGTDSNEGQSSTKKRHPKNKRRIYNIHNHYMGSKRCNNSTCHRCDIARAQFQFVTKYNFYTCTVWVCVNALQYAHNFAYTIAMHSHARDHASLVTHTVPYTVHTTMCRNFLWTCGQPAVITSIFTPQNTPR